jgi:membrane protein
MFSGRQGEERAWGFRGGAVRTASAISHFFSAGIFEIRLGDYSPIRAFFLRWLRVVVFAFHGFVRDGCSSRASLLTYYSLFAIVPVFAMAFGIARGFGLEMLAEGRIAAMAQGMNWPPQVIGQIIGFARTMLARASGGLIAGIGFLALFWSVLSIIHSIEQTLNAIWQVRESRTMVRRVTDYLAVIVFTPILIVISSSAAISLESEVAVVSRRFALVGDLRPAIFVALGALPYVSICAMLTLTYLIIPNTRVRLRSAVAAAVFTGVIYQTVQLVYIKFQLGVSSYGAIYGGFAAIPLFIVWLRLSWMMVLFGAEIAFADENRETYGFHPQTGDLSVWSMKLLFLRVFHLISKRFSDGEPAMSPPQISEALKVPMRLTRRTLDDLSRAGLVVKTAHYVDGEQAFQPARSTEGMRIQAPVEVYEHIGDDPDAVQTQGGAGERVAALLDRLAAAASRLPENVPLKDV